MGRTSNFSKFNGAKITEFKEIEEIIEEASKDSMEELDRKFE